MMPRPTRESYFPSGSIYGSEVESWREEFPNEALRDCYVID